ncbi:hypothetical protein HDU93_005747, partial [Gonapodya sp. JEL0774]
PNGIRSFRYTETVQNAVIFYEKSGCTGLVQGFSTNSWSKSPVTAGKTLASFRITAPFEGRIALRLLFNQVATDFRTVGFQWSAELLQHSLVSNPGALSYDTGSGITSTLKRTTAYQSELASIKRELEKAKGTVHSGSGDLTFSPNTNFYQLDMYFALHRTSYTYTATKAGSKWNIKMKITDTYDFARVDYRGLKIPGSFEDIVPTLKSDLKALAYDAVAIVVNAAATAQDLQVINVYGITINVADTV